MLTLGVDLATQPRLTAVCAISWPEASTQTATVQVLRTGATDEDILELAAEADVVGIDSPFGWPRQWAEAVARHRPGGPFLAPGPPASLTRRATDKWIAENVGVYPLSVGANLIGATAIRCALLIHRMGIAIDTGVAGTSPHVSEVYPAAALVRWGMSHRLYKDASWRQPGPSSSTNSLQPGRPSGLLASRAWPSKPVTALWTRSCAVS